MRTPNPETQSAASPEPPVVREVWEPPSFEVICLACEISSYAPDGDLPLF